MVNPGRRYGSVDNNAEINQAELVSIIGTGDHNKTENVKLQVRSKMKKFWKLGVVIFICSGAALSYEHYTKRKYSMSPPLLSEAEVAAPKGSLLRTEEVALYKDHLFTPPPFSTLDPVADLKVYDYDYRPQASFPGEVFGPLHQGQKKTGVPLPTNKWYENMVLVLDGQDPSTDHVVYTVPFVVNAIGPIPGIKLHATRLLAMEKIVQVTFIDRHGVTLGSAKPLDLSEKSLKEQDAGANKRYLVDYEVGEFSEGAKMSPLTPLGFTLKWDSSTTVMDQSNASSFTKMTSSVVRGMPYGTMHYHYKDGEIDTTLPTVVSHISLAEPPVADSTSKLICKSNINAGIETLVQKSVEISFRESDFTWVVFYSQPVYVRCYEVPGETPFVLQATHLADAQEGDDEVVFTSRVALVNNCTRGTNPSHCVLGHPSDKAEWANLLQDHADVYPGKHTKIDYTFFSDEPNDSAEHSYLQFDWDARRTFDRKPEKDKGVLMYSLPHHREIMRPLTTSPNSEIFNGTRHCTPSLNGEACVIDGSSWVLKEELGGQPSFWAPRPPTASAIPALAEALKDDIQFRLPSYFANGAGDTYFSGKMLAKLSRILLIYKEVNDICSDPSQFGQDYVRQCKGVSLPTSSDFDNALDYLRSSTEIWINGKAESPFVFDSSWGGLVSCGCYFDGNGCSNVFPNCPAFSDPGLDFGHAFYNDHHFHQGYHIYAASTVAYFDEDWGKEMMENVLLLIRDIANPSPDDKYFPVYRMKDWYLGNSWAGGIARAYSNGRNQESSSESIAAYEAISLYGSVMADIWSRQNDNEGKARAARSRHIRDVGRLLTSTELRSADRYWHVRQTGPMKGIYPEQYKPLVVGIMWNMMAQFQTWFGAAPHLAYGIQLLPLTPVSERRDSVDWAMQLYPSFAESCAHATDCDLEGWGILQHAILATVGHPTSAIKYAQTLPANAFTSAGGNGHSLANTIWYYSTRPKIERLIIPSEQTTPSPSPEFDPDNAKGEFDCGCPITCDRKALGYFAGGHSCGERIRWLQKSEGLTQQDACSKVGGLEYMDVCSGCDPDRCSPPKVSPVNSNHVCPPCTMDQCKDESLNRCPVLTAPYLCTEGRNMGGCSMVPWKLASEGGTNCDSCCQLTFECL